MLGRLARAWKAWREKNRQYAIQRALYKAGGGAEPPDIQATGAQSGAPAATHQPDVSRLSEDQR